MHSEGRIFSVLRSTFKDLGRVRDGYYFRTNARKGKTWNSTYGSLLIYLDVAPGVGRFYRKDFLCDLCDLLCK
jgi:hypothetical protein